MATWKIVSSKMKAQTTTQRPKTKMTPTMSPKRKSGVASQNRFTKTKQRLSKSNWIK
jgi:hypothetical protein